MGNVRNELLREQLDECARRAKARGAREAQIAKRKVTAARFAANFITVQPGGLVVWQGPGMQRVPVAPDLGPLHWDPDLIVRTSEDGVSFADALRDHLDIMVDENDDDGLVTVTVHNLGARDWFAILTINCEGSVPLGTFVFSPRTRATRKARSQRTAPSARQHSTPSPSDAAARIASHSL